MVSTSEPPSPDKNDENPVPLFQPKPYWYWILEYFSTNQATQKSFQFTVDVSDVPFILHHFICKRVQFKAFSNIAILSNSEDFLLDYEKKLFHTCGEILPITTTNSDQSGFIQISKPENAKGDYDLVILDSPDVCFDTDQTVIELNYSILTNLQDENMKRYANIDVKKSFSNLHQFFNPYIHQLTETSLSSKSYDLKDISKNWTNILPFNEKLSITESKPNSTLAIELSEMIEKELESISLTVEDLQTEDLELFLWPSQEEQKFPCDENRADAEYRSNPSLNIKVVHERKKNPYQNYIYYPQLDATQNPIKANCKYPLQKAKEVINNVTQIYKELGIWACYRFLSVLVSRSFFDLLKTDDDFPPIVLTSVLETSMKQIWLNLHIKIHHLLEDKRNAKILELLSPKAIALVNILKKYKYVQRKSFQPMRHFDQVNNDSAWLGEGGQLNLSDPFITDDSNIESSIREQTSKQASKSLVGVVFVNSITTAQILTTLINDIATWVVTDCEDVIAGCVDVNDDGNINKAGEDVVHQFKQANLNLLISTPNAILSNGCDFKGD